MHGARPAERTVIPLRQVDFRATWPSLLSPCAQARMPAVEGGHSLPSADRVLSVAHDAHVRKKDLVRGVGPLCAAFFAVAAEQHLAQLVADERRKSILEGVGCCVVGPKEGDPHHDASDSLGRLFADADDGVGDAEGAGLAPDLHDGSEDPGPPRHPLQPGPDDLAAQAVEASQEHVRAHQRSGPRTSHQRLRRGILQRQRALGSSGRAHVCRRRRAGDELRHLEGRGRHAGGPGRAAHHGDAPQAGDEASLHLRRHRGGHG
mmetsp:Transcript_94028/g.275203  ORF Transcript_94028/g.275203 Transcript_94028/m.275203 type:complete len:262 (+) Transcript_94028:394-1179(+)